MPLKILEHLERRARGVEKFEKLLENVPVSLHRAEASERAFSRLRAKIVEIAPTLYELKGLAAGLKAVEKLVRSRQDRVRSEVESERLDPEVGKAIVGELHAVWKSAKMEAKTKLTELARAAGQIDGYYWAAADALDEIARIVAHFERGQRMDEDEDWSGRGTPNGQRPAEGASVTSIGSAKKVCPVRKTPRKSSPKKTVGRKKMVLVDPNVDALKKE